MRIFLLAVQLWPPEVYWLTEDTYTIWEKARKPISLRQSLFIVFVPNLEGRPLGSITVTMKMGFLGFILWYRYRI